MPASRKLRREEEESSSSEEESSSDDDDSSSEDSEEMKIFMEVTCGGRTKALVVDRSYTYAELCAKLASAFHASIDSLTCKDEDGLTMRIRNDKALAGAFEIYARGDADKLKITAHAAGGARVSPKPSRSANALPDLGTATIVDPSLFAFDFGEELAAGLGNATLVDADLFADPSAGAAPPSSSSAPAAASAAAPVADCAIRFRKLNKLGAGTSGTVFKAEDLGKPGRFIAVKEFVDEDSGNTVRSRREIAATRREIEVMSTLKHANIVDYIGTQGSGSTLHILMEYVDGGSLESAIGKSGALPENRVREHTIQLLEGLGYLHENGVIHRDLKPANVLVSASGTLKVADFGCSRRLVGEQTAKSGCMTVSGTPLFMAPEIITGKGHGRKSDVWSLGCTIIEMATGKPPWSELSTGGDKIFLIMHKIASSNSSPTIPRTFSANAVDFIKKCFTRDSARRPTVAELKTHPWIKGSAARK